MLFFVTIPSLLTYSTIRHTRARWHLRSGRKVILQRRSTILQFRTRAFQYHGLTFELSVLPGSTQTSQAMMTR